MFIEEAFCHYNNEVLYFDFSFLNVFRANPDPSIQLVFTKNKSFFNINNLKLYISLNKEFNYIKKLNPFSISDYNLPSHRNSVRPIYNTNVEINNQIVVLYAQYYYRTQNISFDLRNSHYHANIFSDYQLAIKGIEIGGYGNTIFLFISFVEKVLKSYLINLSYIKKNKKILLDIGHNIIKCWKEVEKNITTTDFFNHDKFLNQIEKLYSLYQFDLRYDSGKYSIENAMTANELAINIIDYFLAYTNHNLISEDYD